MENRWNRGRNRVWSALADPGGGSGAILDLEHFSRQVDVLSPTLITDNDRASLLDFATEIVALPST